MEPAIKWPHLAICILPSCLVASKAEGVKHSSPFSRFPPSLTPQIICTISSCTEDDTKAPCATPKLHLRALHTRTRWFPIPTAVSPQHLSAWKQLADEGSACASQWSQKCGLHKTRCCSSFLLFSEKSNKILLTVRSSKYMVFDKKSMPIVACEEMRKPRALKKMSQHLQWLSGEQQQLQEKQVVFFYF